VPKIANRCRFKGTSNAKTASGLHSAVLCGNQVDSEAWSWVLFLLSADFSCIRRGIPSQTDPRSTNFATSVGSALAFSRCLSFRRFSDSLQCDPMIPGLPLQYPFRAVQSRDNPDREGVAVRPWQVLGVAEEEEGTELRLLHFHTRGFPCDLPCLLERCRKFLSIRTRPKTTDFLRRQRPYPTTTARNSRSQMVETKASLSLRPVLKSIIGASSPLLHGQMRPAV